MSRYLEEKEVRSTTEKNAMKTACALTSQLAKEDALLITHSKEGKPYVSSFGVSSFVANNGREVGQLSLWTDRDNRNIVINATTNTLGDITSIKVGEIIEKLSKSGKSTSSERVAIEDLTQLPEDVQKTVSVIEENAYPVPVRKAYGSVMRSVNSISPKLDNGKNDIYVTKEIVDGAYRFTVKNHSNESFAFDVDGKGVIDLKNSVFRTSDEMSRLPETLKSCAMLILSKTGRGEQEQAR